MGLKELNECFSLIPRIFLKLLVINGLPVYPLAFPLPLGEERVKQV